MLRKLPPELHLYLLENFLSLFDKIILSEVSKKNYELIHNSKIKVTYRRENKYIHSHIEFKKACHLIDLSKQKENLLKHLAEYNLDNFSFLERSFYGEANGALFGLNISLLSTSAYFTLMHSLRIEELWDQIDPGYSQLFITLLGSVALSLFLDRIYIDFYLPDEDPRSRRNAHFFMSTLGILAGTISHAINCFTHRSFIGSKAFSKIQNRFFYNATAPILEISSTAALIGGTIGFFSKKYHDNKIQYISEKIAQLDNELGNNIVAIDNTILTL